MIQGFVIEIKVTHNHLELHIGEHFVH